jgi:predicted AlkP superfamily pyrophosphatase or phosphodiesterase
LPATERKLILIVIDGLTPSMLEDTLERGAAPSLRLLSEHGRYRRAISTFPSLTPVCLSALATGAHPDVHQIPHLVWYHRGERRLVEYGSSFGAVRAAGTKQSLIDTIYGLNSSHLGGEAVTVYEALEDAGLTAAAINITCYRGRHAHRPTVPFLTRPAHGPSRFFFYNLFESDVTGAPLSVRNRPRGTIDAYAAAVGRWLVTRDGFDFLVFYLSDYDYASHAQGPDAAHAALARCDDAVGTLIEAAGGEDEFLERYAVLLCSDHGQTPVQEVARLQDVYPDAIVTASNRAGMIYTADDPALLARRLDGNPAVDAVLWRDGDRPFVRRDGADAGVEQLDHPDGPARARAALANPNAGELIVSAAPGWEFADLGGRHHSGGGSHGSLTAGDSEVPMLAVGLDVLPASIIEVMPAVLDHFGVPAPPYARMPAKA